MTDQQVPLLRRISKEQLIVTGGALAATGLVDVATHAGPTGLFFSLCALAIAARHSQDIVNLFVPGANVQEVQEQTDDVLDALLPPVDPDRDQRPLAKLRRLVGMKERTQEHDEPKQPTSEQEVPATPAQPQPTASQAAQSAPVFNQQAAQPQAPQLQRITIDQMVRNTIRNSYDLWIGRSLMQPGNAPVCINIYKKHLKVVGASQQGKSSMAAALLKALLATHDPAYLNVAVLDPEHKTSRLFADDPHIMRVVASYGDRVEERGLHARSEMEVLEMLEIILGVMDYRYTLDEDEIEAQPLLVVYLEEFQALKEYFQQAISQARSDKAEKQAKANYERFKYCIGRIARQGLKVLVQFLVCTQADYADEDFREMFVNIHSGFAFGLRPTTAQSAGFQQTELIKKNYESKQYGQCVAELATCKDLILAPDFDLKKHLKALLPDRGPIYKENRTVNVNLGVSGSFTPSVSGSRSQMESLTENPDLHFPVSENGPDFEHKGTGETPVSVSEEVKNNIAQLHKMGKLTHNEIAKFVGLDGRNWQTYKAVCRELGISTERGSM
jgi:hypothetical protein